MQDSLLCHIQNEEKNSRLEQFFEASETETILSQRKRIVLFFVLFFLGVLLGFGVYWLVEGRYWVSTDDAYVQGDITAIAPKVTGYIESVSVKANQRVKAGDILFYIDNGDYKIAFNDAEAKLATHKSTLSRIKAQVKAALSGLDDAEGAKSVAMAVKNNADLNFKRVEELKQQKVISQSGVDDARSMVDQANANFARSLAQIEIARANIAVLQSQYNESLTMIRSLELALDKARRDLDFTILRAPFDGIIGNLSAQKGDFVIAGQRLAALVPTHELYIDANYKETQLSGIHGGESVHIKIDGIEGQTFEGKVLSLSPASGAVFSLLPPQNATGNFTKVVQRVPVRISLPPQALEKGRIRAGMSAVVSIDTRTTPQEVIAQAQP